jgi:hypothetical protein
LQQCHRQQQQQQQITLANVPIKHEPSPYLQFVKTFFLF